MKRLFKWLGVQDAFDRGMIARSLVILCLTFICFGALFLLVRLVQLILPAFPSVHWADLLLESLLFVFGLAVLWLIRVDKMHTASWLIIGVLLVVVSLQAYFVADPANDVTGAMGLQLLAILSILLLGPRERWFALSVVLVIFLGLNVLSAYGYLDPLITYDPLIKTLFSIFVWSSVSLIISVILFTAMQTVRREPQLIDQNIIQAVKEKKNWTAQNNLLFLSTHDALTGVYNRLFFETESTRLEKSRLFPISIIMAVVDELKDLNDSLGQSVGDQILIDVARIFGVVFRQADIISRYGGDEFAILLPVSDAPIAAEVINRINEQLKTYNKKHSNLPISISMGVSTANQGESLQDHQKLAEKGMRKENLEKTKVSKIKKG